MSFKQGCFLAALTGLCLIAPVYADDISDTSDDINRTQYYPISDNMDLVTKVRFQYAKPRVVVKSVFPELTSDDDEDVSVDDFDDAVTEVVQKSVADFIKQAKLNQETQKQAKPKGNNNLYIDYAAASLKVKEGYIISLRFNTQGVLAGLKQPYHVHRVLNYDLATDEILQLSDLFDEDSDYLEVIADYASGELLKRSKHPDLVKSGTEPTEGNFQNWNLKPNGILITFDEGQVAPAIFGAQTVLVPYEALVDVISPSSPLGDCIEHPKRCMRKSVFTGAFLEAVNAGHRTFNPRLRQL